jgi:hypothetical protein
VLSEDEGRLAHIQSKRFPYSARPNASEWRLRESGRRGMKPPVPSTALNSVIGSLRAQAAGNKSERHSPGLRTVGCSPTSAGAEPLAEEFGWWAVVDSNHINICRRLMECHADDSGKPSKRETGSSAPSNKQPVEFTYRLV